MKRCYLRIGDDFLSDAKHHRTIADAKAAYREVAEELRRYGQRIEASIHFAPSLVECDEYPDYALSLGPRGGVRCERC